MSLEPRLRMATPPFSPLLWLSGFVGVLALYGCGGATYPLGLFGDDGGSDDGGGSDARQTACTGGQRGCDGGDNIGVADFDGGTGDGDARSPGCVVTALACTGGATGYSCPPAVDPTRDQPMLSCTSGVIDGYGVDYCCFPWTAGTMRCTPDKTFPCGNSYAYQCRPGTQPPDLDPKLSCGTNFPDSNGENDFCCTYQ
jgi:hypothetical protein